MRKKLLSMQSAYIEALRYMPDDCKDAKKAIADCLLAIAEALTSALANNE